MSGYGDKPWALVDVKLTNMAGDVQVDLPVGRKLSFKERLVNAELRGDGATVAVGAMPDAVEWSLEAGGISLEAYALMSGRTVVESGTTPSRTLTLAGRAGPSYAYPYFKIYGKSLGDGDDDVHCKILKAKATDGISGDFGDGEFLVTSCGGIAIDDGTTGVFEFVQNETAADLPAT
jgi:hypothetical protein